MKEIIYSPWGFGFFEQGEHPGKMSPQIGIAHLLFGCLGIITLVLVVWKSNYHKFEIHVNDKADFRDNTSYFPEWTAKIDGREIPVEYTKDKFGRLRVNNLSKGKHTVEFFFQEPWYRLTGEYVSLMTIIGILVWFGWSLFIAKATGQTHHYDSNDNSKK